MKAISKLEFRNYLDKLIIEKGADFEAEIKIPGHIGFTYETLINVICEATGARERTRIYTILTAIDFRNGNVFHFLDGMAVAYCEANYDIF